MTKLYSVSFDEERQIIRVRVIGSATHADHCAALDEAVTLCERNRCSKLLVDLRELSTELSSTMNCFDFGELLARTPQYLHIAHVLPADTSSAEDVSFISNVEANRGKETREFHSIQQAEQWLLGEQ
jgi:hypothetical protein